MTRRIEERMLIDVFDFSRSGVSTNIRLSCTEGVTWSRMRAESIWIGKELVGILSREGGGGGKLLWRPIDTYIPKLFNVGGPTTLSGDITSSSPQ